MGRLRVCPVTVIALALIQIGCSDPMIFAEPVATLKAGTDQVTRVVNQSIDDVAHRPELREQFCLTEADAGGSPQTAAAQTANFCGTAWRSASDEARVATARIWFGHEALDALSSYVGALKDLLYADAGDPLRTAAFNLSYAVRALQDATATLPGSGRFERPRNSVSDLASLLAGVHSNLARREALLEAVVVADSIVEDLVKLIAHDVQVAHTLNIQRMPIQMGGAALSALAMRPARSWVSEASLLSGQEVASASDPATALRQLDWAHTALKQAILDGSTRSYEELTYAVDEFALSAEVVFMVYESYLTALNR